jgi:hypothetical protein
MLYFTFYMREDVLPLVEKIKMTFFLSSEDKTLREGLVLEWVGAELKAGSVVALDNGRAPLRKAIVTDVGRPVDSTGRALVDVVANVVVRGERYGLRQLHDSTLGSMWVITRGPYDERLAA